jgi:hypothetical protein
MQKLKLGPLADDKSVKLTVEVSAAVYRDLVAYAEALALETGQPVIERFMASDRGFANARRSLSQKQLKTPGRK